MLGNFKEKRGDKMEYQAQLIKTAFVTFILINMFSTSAKFLDSMQHVQSVGGVENIHEELSNLYGTDGLNHLDGRVSRETLTVKLLGGDTKTIAQVKSACANPSDEIKNMCMTVSAYL